MTMWMLPQTLTPEEEGSITARTHLQLPYQNLPDLTAITTHAQARHLMRMLHPDEPPESLSRRIDDFWKPHTEMNLEDLIAVPLPASRQIALATVTGAYTYRVGEHGSSKHLIPISWPCAPIASSALRKFPELLTLRGICEITDRNARIALHAKLPHSYNRFAKWRWLMAFFMAFGLLRMLQGIGNPQ